MNSNVYAGNFSGIVAVMFFSSVIVAIVTAVIKKSWKPIKFHGSVCAILLLIITIGRIGSANVHSTSNSWAMSFKMAKPMMIILLVLGAAVGTITWSVKRKTWTPVLVAGCLGLMLVLAAGVFISKGLSEERQGVYAPVVTKSYKTDQPGAIQYSDALVGVTEAMGSAVQHKVQNNSVLEELRVVNRNLKLNVAGNSIKGDIWADVDSGAVSSRIKPDVFLTRERSVKFLLTQLEDEVDSLVKDPNKKIEFAIMWGRQGTNTNPKGAISDAAGKLFFNELLKKYPNSSVTRAMGVINPDSGSKTISAVNGKNVTTDTTPGQLVYIEISENIEQDNTLNILTGNTNRGAIRSTPKGSIIMQVKGHNEVSINRVCNFRETAWVKESLEKRGGIYKNYDVIRTIVFTQSPKQTKSWLSQLIADHLSIQLEDWAKREIMIDRNYGHMTVQDNLLILKVPNEQYKKGCIGLIKPYAKKLAKEILESDQVGDFVMQGVTSNGNKLYRAAVLVPKQDINQLAKVLFGEKISARGHNGHRHGLSDLTRKVQAYYATSSVNDSFVHGSGIVASVKNLGQGLGKYGPVVLLCSVIAIFAFILNFGLSGGVGRRILVGVMVASVYLIIFKLS